MSKLQKIKPKGRLSFHSYCGDASGCGAIRIWMPNILLNQYRYKGMSFTSAWNYNFIPDKNFYKNHSFIKLQRPAEEWHLSFIKFFNNHIKKETKTPIIIELDDLLHEIPETNHASAYYKKRWPYISEMLSIVDGLTVSTTPIKDEYSNYNSNIAVISNALARFLWFEPKFRPGKNEKFTILYPGSANHFNQFGEGGDFDNKLLNYIEETRNKFNWIFIGGYPKELEKYKSNEISYYDWQSYFELPRFLKSLNADVGIAPLENNRFNECKSDIKRLEYTSLGIPGVYSNIKPYYNSKALCDNSEDFISWIEYLYENPEKREEIWRSDYSLVKDRLFLEDNLESYVNSHLKLFGKKLG